MACKASRAVSIITTTIVQDNGDGDDDEDNTLVNEWTNPMEHEKKYIN